MRVALIAAALVSPVVTLGSESASTCNVTVASARTRPPAPVPYSFNYGNGTIAVALNPPSGRLVAGRLPGGGERATIDADGRIHAKTGWWRAGDGPIAITGQRLDGPAPKLVADVPDGYARGFQATMLIYPTTGCWRVTGRFKRASVSFTVYVTRSRLGP